MRGGGKTQKRQERSPPGVKFIDLNRGPHSAGENGDIARASARLKNRHAALKGGRLDQRKSSRGRSAELLIFNLRLIAGRLKG